jgi:hypothetical protein
MVGELPDSNELAALIREELGRRRQTRQWLADEAQISLSTLEKALAGQRPFTLATVVRIEGALGIPLRGSSGARAHSGGGEIAPEELGAYARPAVKWLIGEYVTVRPSFETQGAFYSYRTSIAWSEERGRLIFSESQRRDAPYAQRGEVALPHQSGQIYLVTREEGQFRLAILGRPAINGALYGLLSTLQARGGALTPLSCPIALLPEAMVPSRPFGLVGRAHADYFLLGDHMRRVEREGFGRLLAAPEA